MPTETAAGETRVAFVPALGGALWGDQHEILVEGGAVTSAAVRADRPWFQGTAKDKWS
jgi:NAD/NADP transhydrogenase alpha subunit